MVVNLLLLCVVAGLDLVDKVPLLPAQEGGQVHAQPGEGVHNTFLLQLNDKPLHRHN